MKRGVTRAGQERILDRIRSHVPDITLRSTFIVGFPGETDEDFETLCSFVREQQFDHLGVFTYFAEDGTPAAELPHQVPDAVKDERMKHLLDIQRGISRSKLQKWVGRKVDVLVEGVSSESDTLLRGRTAHQAPDVDGMVYIASAPADAKVGEIRKMLITQAGDYDLVAHWGA